MEPDDQNSQPDLAAACPLIISVGVMGDSAQVIVLLDLRRLGGRPDGRDLLQYAGRQGCDRLERVWFIPVPVEEISGGSSQKKCNRSTTGSVAVFY